MPRGSSGCSARRRGGAGTTFGCGGISSTGFRPRSGAGCSSNGTGRRTAGSGCRAGGWTVWLLMAGRGFGKTRAGAEWVSERAREGPQARIALVGGSRDDVAKVMIEGPSGLISVARLRRGAAVDADARHPQVFERGDGVRLFGRGARGAARPRARFRLGRRARQMALKRPMRRGTI